MGNETSNRRTSEELLDKEIGILKANSQLSEQQIRKLYDEFKSECPSGRMDRNQFHKFYKQAAGSEDKGGQLSDNVFTVFDNNRDGSIDFGEFTLAYAVGNNGDLDSQLDLAFEMIDISRDGRISYEEMVAFMEKALRMSDPTQTKGMNSRSAATDVFQMFNLDEGQKLNKQQFLQGCKTNKAIAQMFGPS